MFGLGQRKRKKLEVRQRRDLKVCLWLIEEQKEPKDRDQEHYSDNDLSHRGVSWPEESLFAGFFFSGSLGRGFFFGRLFWRFGGGGLC